MIAKGETWMDGAGRRVIIHAIKLYNSCEEKVTYPVKGTVILKEKPRRTMQEIYTLEGKVNVVWDSPMENLIKRLSE